MPDASEIGIRQDLKHSLWVVKKGELNCKIAHGTPAGGAAGRLLAMARPCSVVL